MIGKNVEIEKDDLLIESIKHCHSSEMANYIDFIRARLIEIKRVLEPTGSGLPSL